MTECVHPVTLLHELERAVEPRQHVRPTRYTPLFQECIKTIRHLSGPGMPTGKRVNEKLDRILAHLEYHLPLVKTAPDADPDCLMPLLCDPETDGPCSFCGAEVGRYHAPSCPLCQGVDLEPCPGCGMLPKFVRQDAEGLVGGHCDECNIHSPLMDDTVNAVVIWNAVVDAWNGGFKTAEDHRRALRPPRV